MNPYLQNNRHFGKTSSLLLCVAAYVLALVFAGIYCWYYGSVDCLISIFIADVIATLVIFGLGGWVNNASLYDPYWSVIPVFIAGVWWSLSDFEFSSGKVLLMIVLIYWAIRLTLNWARGWPGLHHEDWRYGMLRQKHGSLYPLVNLGGIHLFPTVLVFLGMLPTYYVLSTTNPSNFWLEIVAFIIGISATSIELIADEQLRAFKKNQSDPQQFLQSGLWKYSRHPNYFGEVTFWFSLFLFALAIDPAAYWWTGVGVLAMFLLFWFISIPMMEERMQQKRKSYAAYVKSTSRFFLLPFIFSSSKK